MKITRFLGDSKDRIRGFPAGARNDAGQQIFRVQLGLEPKDWKPLSVVGPGVREIRIRDERGAYRVVYISTIEDAVYVLHAFQQKTQATPNLDLALAARRLAELTRR